jgi:2-polyprenyl-3-methyl-5-hydroxy-6-metoxy-1,4-benzoquinol methylase
MGDPIKEGQARLKLFKKYGYDIPKARNFILAKAKLSKGRVLEVGTGKGHLAIVLAKKGFKFTSIDLDRKAQKVAKIILKELRLDKFAVLKIMNAERLRFSNDCFDSVISVNFIHHADNPVKCIKEMVRVAKEKLIIADLNKRGECIMEKVHSLDGHNHHASKMSLSSARTLLEKLGLSVKTYHDSCQIVLVAKKGAVK